MSLVALLGLPPSRVKLIRATTRQPRNSAMDSQVSDVPKRMGTLRTQTNATNIMTASMVLPRIVYALMVQCSTHFQGRGSLVTIISMLTVETVLTSNLQRAQVACVDGTAEEYTCSSGLWFDEYSGVCNWPETTDR